MTTERSTCDEQTVTLAVDGILDLHGFSPKDIKYLIPDYLQLCHAAGIFHVRIIHGKGVGNLRRAVHAILARHPLVKALKMADLDTGAWGATCVELLPHRSKQSSGSSGSTT